MKTKQIKKMKVMTLGKVVDSSGKSYDWTLDDFNEFVKNYSYTSDEQAAPIVLTHETKSQPRFGHVDRVWIEDGALCCSAQVEEKLFDACEQGFYPNRSISVFTKSKTINHLAILGAQKPAFENLGIAVFSAREEKGEEVASFGFWVENGEVSQALKNRLENAESDIGEIKKALNDILSMVKKTDYSASGQENSAEFSAEKKKLESIKSEIADVEKARLETIKSYAADFSKMLIENGKIFPAWKENVEKEFISAFAKGNDELLKVKQTYEGFVSVPELLSKGLPAQSSEYGKNSVSALVQKANNYIKEQAEKGVAIEFKDAMAKINEGVEG